jgi:general secretion pathway protein I
MAAAPSKSGFTLLEVLVALAILSVALGALYHIFSAGLDYQTKAAREAEAVSIAQSLLARVGADVPVKAGESSGEIDNGFFWSLTVTPIDAPTGAAALPVDVKATVTWHSGGSERSVTLQSTRLIPRATLP